MADISSVSPVVGVDYNVLYQTNLYYTSYHTIVIALLLFYLLFTFYSKISKLVLTVVIVQLDCASSTRFLGKFFLRSAPGPTQQAVVSRPDTSSTASSNGTAVFHPTAPTDPPKEPGGSQPGWRSVDCPSVSTVMEYWCVLPELISLQKDVEVSLSLMATRTSSTSESSVSEPFLLFHSHLSHVWLHENRATITS